MRLHTCVSVPRHAAAAPASSRPGSMIHRTPERLVAMSGPGWGGDGDADAAAAKEEAPFGATRDRLRSVDNDAQLASALGLPGELLAPHEDPCTWGTGFLQAGRRPPESATRKPPSLCQRTSVV